MAPSIPPVILNPGVHRLGQVVEAEGFQKRATVVVKPGEEENFTIESSLSPEAVDLGGRMAADQGKGDRLNQLLELVDEVQDAEGGEDILRALLRRVAHEAASERAAAVPCASRDCASGDQSPRRRHRGHSLR